MDGEIGPQQHQQPGDSHSQPDLASPRDVMIAQQEGIQYQKPKGGHGDDQCRQAGGYMLLRIGQGQVAAQEQQHPHNRHLPQLPRLVSNLSPAQSAIGEHEHARDQEAYAAHQSRGNMFDRDVDAEIGRSPEEIHQREGKDYGEAMLALGVGHGREART